MKYLLIEISYCSIKKSRGGLIINDKDGREWYQSNYQQNYQQKQQIKKIIKVIDNNGMQKNESEINLNYFYR